MATLKISDLSVGDWVEFRRTRGIYITPPLFDHANAQVIGIHRGAEVSLLVDGKREFIAMPLSAIRPIPITAEILEKNGFERSTSEFIVYHTDKVWISYDKPSETWSVTMYINDFTSNLHANILYIHQLQHLIRLAGVDKEINL